MCLNIYLYVGLLRGDFVSVYADMDKKCLKGSTGVYTGATMFVGNGRAEMSRDDLFGKNKYEKCVQKIMLL